MKLPRRRKTKNEEIWLWAYADLITNLLIFFVALLAATELSQVKLQEVAEKLSGKRTEDSLSSIQDQLQSEIKALNYQDIVRTDLTRDGLEISFDSGVMFPSGSAEIRSNYQEVMNTVMAKVVPYSQRYRFAIEGHTDARPLAPQSKYESNWELSSARALEVRKKLAHTGIPQEKVRIESYASNKPIPNSKLAGLSGEEMQSRQRRVVIRIF